MECDLTISKIFSKSVANFVSSVSNIFMTRVVLLIYFYWFLLFTPVMKHNTKCISMLFSYPLCLLFLLIPTDKCKTTSAFTSTRFSNGNILMVLRPGNHLRHVIAYCHGYCGISWHILGHRDVWRLGLWEMRDNDDNDNIGCDYGDDGDENDE